MGSLAEFFGALFPDQCDVRRDVPKSGLTADNTIVLADTTLQYADSGPWSYHYGPIKQLDPASNPPGILEGKLTVPEESQVILGVGFGCNANEFTGAFKVPADTEVIEGVSFGSGMSGRVALPIENDVRSGVFYGPNNSRTGTLFVGGGGGPGPAPTGYPEIRDVRSGIHYGPDMANPLVGDLVVPEEQHVRYGVEFDAALPNRRAGVLVVPSASSVIAGVDFGPDFSLHGAFEVPKAFEVKEGVSFGYQGAIVGSFVDYPEDDLYKLLLELDLVIKSGEEFTATSIYDSPKDVTWTRIMDPNPPPLMPDDKRLLPLFQQAAAIIKTGEEFRVTSQYDADHDVMFTRK